MAGEKYSSLKKFVERECGRRGQMHSKARDRLVEIAVEEFPHDAQDDLCLDVLTARMRRRIREEYGSVVAILLISIIANLVARAVWDWWKNRRSHRISMIGWQEEARAEKN